MKNLFITTLCILFALSTMFAQNGLDNYAFTPDIKEGQRLMSKGQKNSYSVIIDGVSRKDIEKNWEKYIKNHDTKSKWDKKKNEYLADNAKIETISDNTIDVYNQLIESGSSTEVIVWFDLGGAFLSSYDHPQKAEFGKKFITDFALRMEKKRVDQYREKQEDMLEDLEDNLKDMRKDKEDLVEDIADYEKKIAEAKEKIAENESKQAQKEVEIETQRTIVEKVKTIRSGLDKNY